MKKIVTILLAGLLAVGIVGCASPRDQFRNSIGKDLNEATRELQSALNELEKLGQSLESEIATLASSETAPVAPAPSLPENRTPSQLEEDAEISKQMETIDEVMESEDKAFSALESELGDLNEFFKNIDPSDLPSLPSLPGLPNAN